ncbi:MAG: hypothetical protein IJM63_01105 [Solobacterium sp.]|nr:hypothetical protein [Solobacterium sp.]MBQ9823068.1 hypothetical protein [Solobacterium sp.]
MKKNIILVLIGALLTCCTFVHRNVIKAIIKKEPLPKAPKWHCWVPEENRRTE